MWLLLCNPPVLEMHNPGGFQGADAHRIKVAFFHFCAQYFHKGLFVLRAIYLMDIVGARNHNFRYNIMTNG